MSNRINDLQVGYVLHFGAMKQPLLHRKRYAIQEIWTYNIDLQKLYTFVLNNTPGNLLYMILGEDEGEEYLTISSQITAEMLEEFSGIRNFSEWLVNEGEQQLRFYGKPGGKLKHWLSNSYRRVMHDVEGYIYPADFRGRLLSGDASTGKPFRNFLFVSSDQRHALDCELYPDGSLRIFATIYRPITDIRQVIPAPALQDPIRRTQPDKLIRGDHSPTNLARPPILPPKPASTRPVKHGTEQPSFQTVLEKTAETPVTQQEITAPREIAEETRPGPSDTKPDQPNETPPKDVAPVEQVEKERIERIAKAPASEAEAIEETTTLPTPGQHENIKEKPPVTVAGIHHEQDVDKEHQPVELDFEVRLAATLIEEASRNHITLEEVIRKVLGLSIDVSEYVHFRMNLSDEDYHKLSERYHLPLGETDTIRRNIINELAEFAGNGHPKKMQPVIREKKVKPASSKDEEAPREKDLA